MGEFLDSDITGVPEHWLEDVERIKQQTHGPTDNNDLNPSPPDHWLEDLERLLDIPQESQQTEPIDLEIEEVNTLSVHQEDKPLQETPAPIEPLDLDQQEVSLHDDTDTSPPPFNKQASPIERDDTTLIHEGFQLDLEEEPLQAVEKTAPLKEEIEPQKDPQLPIQEDLQQLEPIETSTSKEPSFIEEGLQSDELKHHSHNLIQENKSQKPTYIEENFQESEEPLKIPVPIQNKERLEKPHRTQPIQQAHPALSSLHLKAEDSPSTLNIQPTKSLDQEIQKVQKPEVHSSEKNKVNNSQSQVESISVNTATTIEPPQQQEHTPRAQPVKDQDEPAESIVSTFEQEKNKLQLEVPKQILETSFRPALNQPLPDLDLEPIQINPSEPIKKTFHHREQNIELNEPIVPSTINHQAPPTQPKPTIEELTLSPPPQPKSNLNYSTTTDLPKQEPLKQQSISLEPDLEIEVSKSEPTRKSKTIPQSHVHPPESPVNAHEPSPLTQNKVINQQHQSVETKEKNEVIQTPPLIQNHVSYQRKIETYDQTQIQVTKHISSPTPIKHSTQMDPWPNLPEQKETPAHQTIVQTNSNTTMDALITEQQGDVWNV